MAFVRVEEEKTDKIVKIEREETRWEIKLMKIRMKNRSN